MVVGIDRAWGSLQRPHGMLWYCKKNKKQNTQKQQNWPLDSYRADFGKILVENQLEKSGDHAPLPLISRYPEIKGGGTCSPDFSN